MTSSAVAMFAIIQTAFASRGYRRKTIFLIGCAMRQACTRSCAVNGKLRISYELGHNIYTPDDISKTTLIADERLYAGVGLVSDSWQRLDNLQLSIGIVGPSALGKDVQRYWHDLINTTDPRGWDNQLKDELTIMLTYERKWRRFHEFKAGGLGVDFTPHVGAALGNVFTHAAAGVTVRIGDDLPNDYGPPRIRPSLPGSDFFVNRDKFGWCLVAGFEGRRHRPQ